MFFCSLPGSDIQLEFFDSLAGIQKNWDAVLPENHALRSPIWLAIEKADLPEMELRFVRINRGEKMIGLAAFQIIRLSQQSFQPTAFSSQIKTWLMDLIKSKGTCVMICGNLLMQNQEGFYFENQDDQQEIFAVAKRLSQLEKGDLKPSIILIKDCDSFKGQLAKKTPYGFQPYLDDATFEMVIDSNWVHFQDYKESLSKKYAQRVHKIRLAGEPIQKRKLTLEEMEALGEKINATYQQVLHKQPFRPVQLNKEYFKNMAGRVGDIPFEFWGYFLEENLVGFSSYLWRPENELEMHYIGFDSAANHTHLLYFNMLFDGLEKAILSRSQKLLLGRGGDDAKWSLGATKVPRFHYLSVKRGINQLIFNAISRQIKELMTKPKVDRNPFKKSETTSSMAV